MTYTNMLGEREREIYEFLQSHLEIKVYQYAVPAGPTVQLVLCGEIISEASLEPEQSMDGY